LSIWKEVTERDDGIPVGREGNTGDEPGGERGEAMRKAAVIALVMMVSVALAASVMAQSGVKEECVALTKDAAKFINEKGLDAAIAEINNKEGKFVTKNTYVFLMDLEGNELAHPYHALTGLPASAVTASGRNILKLFDYKDTTGKLFVQEFIKVAKTKGEGWVEYMYPTPEEQKKPIPFKEKKSSKKINYVYRVPGKDLMTIAGFFE
jgi:signal transduction histidine kinase